MIKLDIESKEDLLLLRYCVKAQMQLMPHTSREEAERILVNLDKKVEEISSDKK